MTPEQREIAISFDKVTFLPGTWNKRFAASMSTKARYATEIDLTEKENEWLYRLLYTFRRQIPEVYEKYQSNPNCRKK